MGVLVKNKINYTGSGAKEEIITYAQYLALSEEQRNNGTTYYVSDINGDGEDFQPIIYSTDEREVGVWIDGKPLYQKTKTYLNISGATGASLDTIANIADNIDILFIKDSMIEVGTGTYFVNGNYYDGSSWRCQLLKTANDILYYASWGGGSFNFTVTYLYTKTTDTPGSGTWTPQGVPAQHYSTNEQVVGTWIDGKTLYEKTYKFTAPSGATAGTTLTSVADLSIDYVASLQAIAINPTTHRTWPLSSNYSNGGGIVILSGNDNNDNIEYRCYNDTFAGYELIVTIRYTKTSS